MNTSLASFPLRISRASGSVLLSCVSFLNLSLRKSTDGLLGSSSGCCRSSSLRLKLLMLAAASISVPSTLKCSSDKSPCRSAFHTTSSNSAWPILCSSNRCRFFVDTVGSKLRTEYREMSYDAFSSRSGGTDARPTFEYIRSNSGASRSSASSATVLIVRRGWSFGTRSSKSTKSSIVAWRITSAAHEPDTSITSWWYPISRTCFSAACYSAPTRLRTS